MENHRKQRRTLAAAPTHGELTKTEVDLLLNLQDRLCFYCAEEFSEGPRGTVFDRDHYVAIASDGKSTMENTVLACLKCHRSKGDVDRYTFELLMRKQRRPEMKARYAQMLRRFRETFARLGREHVACIFGAAQG